MNGCTDNKRNLWLCLYLFELPINIVLQRHLSNLDTDAPVAVVEQQRIAFVNEAARNAGIDVDMRPATAYALLPSVHLIERQRPQEAEALQQLAQWCYQFTPAVDTYKTFCLMLEINGSLKLFGGLPKLLDAIGSGLQVLGYSFRHGLGHTRLSAWLFSQLPEQIIEANNHRPNADFFMQRLANIPLSYLDIPNKQAQQLFNLGLRRIGELLALPKKSLGRRFGHGLVKLMQEITGETADLHMDKTPPEQFEAQVEFANGITQLDELQQPLQTLLEKFSRFLSQLHYHPPAFRWRFFYFNLPADTLEITLASNNHGLPHLLTLTQGQLERFQLQAPVECLQLCCDRFIEASPASRELFVELSHPDNQLAHYRLLLDKLENRLGDNALYGITIHDEHLPEYRQQVLSVSLSETNSNISTACLDAQTPGSTDPLWLCPQPQPITQHRQILYYGGPLQIVRGPQRIDSHWWQQRQQRDYFIARHKNGSHYWIFRDLVTQEWFVHGLYG